MTLVIDVDFKLLKQIKRTATQDKYFLIDKKETVEIYVWFNNILFRSFYHKKGDENDLLFEQTSLGSYVFVNSIMNINEDKWQNLALMMLNKLSGIEDEIKLLRFDLNDKFSQRTA